MSSSSGVHRVARMSPGLVERYRDDEQCLLWHGNVQLVLSRAIPSRMFMRRIGWELDVLAGQCQTRTGALLIMRGDVNPPTEDERRYICAEMKKSSMAAAAQVVLGTGFQGSTMRSILTLIQTSLRPPYPMKVFSAAPAGALWLAQELNARVGRAPAAGDLARLARDAQERFLAPEPLAPLVSLPA